MAKDLYEVGEAPPLGEVPATMHAQVVRPDRYGDPEKAIQDEVLPVPELGSPHEAIVDGDALCHSIAAASVIAKTIRDRLMERLAPRYPQYAWESNKGYGTPEHLVALVAHGCTAHHRKSFAPVVQLEFTGFATAPSA